MLSIKHSLFHLRPLSQTISTWLYEICSLSEVMAVTWLTEKCEAAVWPDFPEQKVHGCVDLLSLMLTVSLA